MIQVGEWVDVALTTDITWPDGATQDTRTANIACACKVIAKRNSLWPIYACLPEDAPVHYTLEANPWRAALINFCKDKGLLTLTPVPEAEQRLLEGRRNDYLAALPVGEDLTLRDNPTARREQFTLTGSKEGVWSVAFSRDGKRVAGVAGAGPGRGVETAKEQVEMILWDPATREQVSTVTGDPLTVRSVAFSPNGQWMAFGAQDGSVRAWHVVRRAGRDKDVAFKEKDISFERGPQAATSVHFSPDSSVLAVCYGRSIKLWDVSEGKDRLTISQSHNDCVLAFSPDGQHLAVGHEAGVDLRDVSTGKLIGGTLAVDYDGVRSVAFSSNGQFLAAGTKRGPIRLWETPTGDAKPDPAVARSGDLATTWKFARDLKGHSGEVLDVVFRSPDCLCLASASADKTARFWDVQSPTEVLRFVGHTAPVQAVAFSPDGIRVASAGQDKLVKVWGCPKDCKAKPTGLLVFCGDLNSEQYRDEENLVLGYLRGDYTVNDQTLVELFHPTAPAAAPPSPPPLTVEQFAGLKRQANVVFAAGSKTGVEEQPGKQAARTPGRGAPTVAGAAGFRFSIPPTTTDSTQPARNTPARRPTNVLRPTGTQTASVDHAEH
jgi:WD40 repeat protein